MNLSQYYLAYMVPFLGHSHKYLPVLLFLLPVISTGLPSRPIDFETYIPSTIGGNCDLAVFTSKRPLPFEFNPSKRITIISNTNKFYFTTICTVLILVNFVKTTEVEEIFVRTNFVHVKLVIIFPKSNFSLHDLKLTRDSFHKNILVIGNDGVSKFPRLSNAQNKHCRHTDPSCILKGISLRVGYTQVQPYLQVEGWIEVKPGAPIVRSAPLTLSRLNMDVNFRKLAGVEGQVIKYMVEQYGIIFNMISPPEMISGTKSSNGSWNGKYGMLSRGDIDMVAGSVVGNFEKHQLGEYSAPIFYIMFGLCSLKPKPLPNWQAPLQPLPWLGWLALLFSILIVGPAIWGITKLHTNMTNSPQPEQTVFHITAQAGTTLLVEPWLKPPKGPAALIITAWLLACLILQCIYGSNLTAYLSIPRRSNAVRTLEDVLVQDRTVLLYKGGTLDFFMRNSKDPVVQYLMKHKTTYINRSRDNGPRVLQNPKFVGTNEVGIFKYKILKEGKNPSDYYVSKKPLMGNFAGWLFKKDNFFIPAINAAILRATESGLVYKWYTDQFIVNASKSKYSNSYYTKEKVSKGKETPLSLGHVEGILLFWLFGLSLSTFVFVLEVIIFKLKKCRVIVNVLHSRRNVNYSFHH